ncbi:hypothetical protein L484_006240 [Morus notabilis]|uniref:Uncharacterized protein n=1 Tax=Morus notabilis TaxID=981085 RepID=W9QRE5_9ROSA|nr:hypothetical protein L484_006240 [Morus notabilis]
MWRPCRLDLPVQCCGSQISLAVELHKVRLTSLSLLSVLCCVDVHKISSPIVNYPPFVMFSAHLGATAALISLWRCLAKP